jgi:hypothetical protein
MDQDEEMAEE